MVENIRQESLIPFSLIGAGNLGVALICTLRHNGYSLQNVFIKSKDSALSSFYESNLELLIKKSVFIFIAVQESKMDKVIKKLACEQGLEGKVFFHVANSLTSDKLNSLRDKGAAVASFSPLQTFPAKTPSHPDPFKDIYFLLEGDEKAKKIARSIASSIGAYVIEVKKEEKVFFHIAAIAVSNFVISLFKFAENQMAKSNVSKENGIKIFFPLIKQTLRNVEHLGVMPSLSGPLVRGESELLKKMSFNLSGIDKDLFKMHINHLKQCVADESHKKKCNKIKGGIDE